ncbi:MAG: potassium transporter Kup [Burkholderiales bacterium]|jgi:KUP system potassium uptake protein|nr:potassium transporter Kup [Burkholderiales bacterium]
MASPAALGHNGHAQSQSPLALLTLGAIGVVFGDIGTSPLYAFKEAFGGAHALALTEAHVLGVLSMIFWAVTLIVSFKYVLFVLNFDNKGEGGVLALLAYATRLMRNKPELQWWVAVAAVFAASLFYGDAVITPAISVLSAVEGLSVAAPALESWIVPLTIAIIVVLFAIQHRGTGRVGRYFGPITVAWFLTIATLGVLSILQNPDILRAINPRYAVAFAVESPGAAFLALGAVFLTLTGGEALYADMGHFGPKPIRIGWFGLVFPSLMLNYLGQGALVLRDPSAAKNPFYLLAPDFLVLPLVALATVATVIASQATISGAFSVTQQASRLGYLPHIPARHTSESERGQIYIPQVNWILLVIVLILVLEFGSSSALAAAYGIAVSATMLLETGLVAVVAYALLPRWRPLVLAGLAVVATAEFLFFLSNSTKILAGGWFPLVCGLVVFTLLTTWKRATGVIRAEEARHRVPIKGFFELLGDVPRVQGTAIYLSSDSGAVPTTLLHNLKHNKILHERILFISIVTEDVPRIADLERTEVEVLEPKRLFRVKLHYGFMEDPDVLRGLQLLERHGLKFELMDTTFFLGKSTIAPAKKRGLFTWRRTLFRWMQRNSPSAAEYFRLPPDRVIELGTRVTV